MSKTIFAVDLGNSNTDFVTPDGVMVSIPSLVAPGRKAKPTYSFGADLMGGAQKKPAFMDKLVLADATGIYYVGASALDNASGEEITLAFDQKQSLIAKQKLLRVAMAFSLPQRCDDIHLLLSYPYKNAELAPVMEQMALGEHKYTLNGKEYSHTVVAVQTMPQVIAGFYGVVFNRDFTPNTDYLHYFDRKIIIDDIGGGTRDICTLGKNFSGELGPLSQHSDSEKWGVLRAIKRIQEVVEVNYGLTIPEVDIDRELYVPARDQLGNFVLDDDGQLVFEERDFLTINGELVDVKEIKEAAFKWAVDGGFAFLTNIIPESIRNSAGLVLSMGGGSVRFKRFLEPYYKELFGMRYHFASRTSIAWGQWIKANRPGTWD